MEKVILEENGLSRHFGGLKVIDTIDVQLHYREIIANVGDNGAGKPTLIKTISGVYEKNNIYCFSINL